MEAFFIWSLPSSSTSLSSSSSSRTTDDSPLQPERAAEPENTRQPKWVQQPKWLQLWIYARIFHNFLVHEYFRNVLCLVLGKFAELDAEMVSVLGIEIIDVDVAMRKCSGLHDDETLSSREQRRLYEIQRTDILEKTANAVIFTTLGFEVKKDQFYHTHDYPFTVRHSNRRHIWDEIDKTHAMQYRPPPLQTACEGSILPECFFF